VRLSPYGMLPIRLWRARAAACLLLQQRVDALRGNTLVHLQRPNQASPGRRRAAVPAAAPAAALTSAASGSQPSARCTASVGAGSASWFQYVRAWNLATSCCGRPAADSST